ncbi:MAG: archaellin/type IV pilin N-terminal domain-containing protein [Nanoarchaeota archaeon]
MKNKQGISGVIATVLLIMLTVGVASILFVFIVPWITSLLDNAKICNDMQESVTIVEGKYTCYNSTYTKVMIKINEGKEVEVDSFSVSLASSGSAKRYDIKNGVSINSGGVIVSMFNGSTKLAVPDVGGAETYVFNFKAESVDVAPVLASGKTCDAVSQKLIDCSQA